MKIIDVTKRFRNIIAIAIASLFILLAAGCGGGGGGGTSVTAKTLDAVLSGAQEVPPTTSTASGTATVTVDAARTTITVSMTTQGFTTPVTASHIHFGASGVNGGVMLSLFAGPGAFPATLTKTLISTDLDPGFAAAGNTFADAVNAILNGNAYINVHTSVNVDGEIRGQLTLPVTPQVMTPAPQVMTPY